MTGTISLTYFSLALNIEKRGTRREINSLRRQRRWSLILYAFESPPRNEFEQSQGLREREKEGKDLRTSRRLLHERRGEHGGNDHRNQSDGERREKERKHVSDVLFRASLFLSLGTRQLFALSRDNCFNRNNFLILFSGLN